MELDTYLVAAAHLRFGSSLVSLVPPAYTSLFLPSRCFEAQERKQHITTAVCFGPVFSLLPGHILLRGHIGCHKRVPTLFKSAHSQTKLLYPIFAFHSREASEA